MNLAILLSEAERDAFAHLETEKAQSKSLTDRLFWSPLFQRLAGLVPSDVSPNVLSLTSALCLLQGWYMSETYSQGFPTLSRFFLMVFILIWFALDQVDEYHAVNIGNNYGFVHLFDHVCSSLALVFVGISLSKELLGHVSSVESIWYSVQIMQFIVLNKHVQSLSTGIVQYRWYWGPGEGVLLILLVLGVKLVSPWCDDGLFSAFQEETVLSQLAVVYFLLHVYFVYLTKQLTSASRSKFLLQCCIFILYLPSLLDLFLRLFYNSNNSTTRTTTEASIISDGIVLSVLTCDVVLCRVTPGRQLHPVLLILCLMSTLSVPLTLFACALYFLTLFFELSVSLRLPILGVIRNVYVDGIFDMVHIGHLRHFERAAKLGTRLFVGVVNDEDASPYKRKPIMTHQERCELVLASKNVYKVIPNAPCVKGGLNLAFLKKHNIHIVGCGEEYEVEGDEWYAVPRRLGMTRVLPRTTGMSTSDLIKRIQNRKDE